MVREKVLFVCIGNMCRSRMAEGLLAHFGAERFESHSCGVMGSGDSRHAIKAQQKLGIDASEQWSKSWREVRDLKPDYVIFLDEYAKQQIPAFPGAGEVLDWFVDDPIETIGKEEEIQRVYDDTRDRIARLINEYFKLEIPLG